MKNIIKNLALAFIASFTIVSCGTDDKSSSKDQSKKEYSISKDGKSVSYSYKTDEEKLEILADISNDYLESVYLKEELDTRYQVSGAMIQEDKVNKTLKIEFETVNLGNMTDAELVTFMIAYPLEYVNHLQLQTEKLEHYCDGGSKNGSSMTLDRPNGPGSAYKYAKQVAKFAQACLNGGGCLQICSAYVVLVPNTDLLKIKSNIELKEYQELLEISKVAIFSKLDKKI